VAAAKADPGSRHVAFPWLRIGAVVFAGFVVLAVITALDARAANRAINSARDQLNEVVHNPATLSTPEGRAAARARIGYAVDDAATARRRVARSPLLYLARVVPPLANQRRGVLALIDDVSTGAAAARDLLDSVNSLAASSDVSGGAIPLDGLDRVDREVDVAANRIAGLARGSQGLWPPVSGARRHFDASARDGAARLHGSAETVGAVRTFLGAAGERRYLIALQNNAEMRDQGMVLSYSVVRFAAGKATVERSGPIHDFTLDHPASTAIPDGTREVFGSINPTQQWLNVNATADFAFSGRAMVDMYREATGHSVDGVIALDVPAVAGLLRVVGPVSVDGIPEPISADNVGRILLHDLYEGLGDNDDQGPRRERLAEVSSAVIARLTGGNLNAVTLGRELSQSAAGGHLRLYASDAAEQQVFERRGLGGGPAGAAADRTFHIAVENRTASKMDYYIKPRVVQAVRLGADGAATVTTTVTVDNQAPVGAAPSYQLGPDGQNQKAPGEYLAWVLLWAPAGSTQQQSVSESGLHLQQSVVLVEPGKSRDVVFETVVPAAVRGGRLDLRLVPQPRLEPVPLEVRIGGPGWRVGGDRVWKGKWEQTLSLSWSARR